MKTTVRNILHDLVEKRLWPVAIALLVCIVAAPLVLARGGTPAGAPVTGAAPGPAADGPAVRLADSTASSREHGGRVRNPFGTAADGAPTPAPGTVSASASGASASGSAGSASPAVAVRASSSAGSSTSSAPASSSSTPAGGSSATSTPSTTPATSQTTTATSPKAGTSATFSVAVRFGRTDGDRRTLRNIARLTALPNAKAPVVSLLGVLRDGRTAVVKVAANTTAHGNGTCKPSASRCTILEMKAGDAEYLEVASAGGDAVAWYYLKLLHVDRHETTSETVATAAYARRSAAGMAVVRRDAASVRSYRYLPGLGVLVRAKRRITASAAKASDHAVERLLPAAEQEGVAVWRSVPRPKKR